MATFTSLLEGMKATESYSEKTQFLAYILNCTKNGQVKLDAEDMAELSSLVFTEAERLIPVIPAIEKYVEKDAYINYAKHLFAILMLCYPSPAGIAEDKLESIKMLQAIIEKETFVENQIDEIFEKGNNSPADLERLFCMIIPLKDEYQKGLFFQGMLHYKENIPKMPEESCELISKYIASELERYLSVEPTEEVRASLEFACDVSKFFIDEKIAALLQKVLLLGFNNVSFFASETLLFADFDVSTEVISVLARDLVHADSTYSMLKKLGKTHLFPSELATPEYLAKSNLVHWLTYPTELGGEPDAIEYLGKVKKKDVYYVFRYRSVSDTLSDELKGKWLIGWSSNDGGTFSNFDRYDDFVQKTPEKTLKYIKKKLL